MTINAQDNNVPVEKSKAAIGTTEKSIAVLPFVNLSSDPEQVYFSDGITEDILNHLVKISDLKVKSRTSAFKYKDSKKNIFEIGQELGVRSILEGSIRKAGNMVRIVVQLIDASRDENLWSETYDRELKDVLNVQSEIALEIARALKAKLTTSEESNINSQASSDITAYDYFLKARQIITVSNDDRKDYEIAVQLLDKAIELDPKFAAAYALKAAAWYKQSNYGVFYKTWTDSSLYYASTAIKLNPSLPDGYLVRGSISLFLKGISKSREDLQRAYEVAPNNPLVLDALGNNLLLMNDARGADMLLKSLSFKYSKHDPDYYWDLGRLYFEAENYVEAEKSLKKGRSLDPKNLDFYWLLAFVYRAAEKYPEFLTESQAAVRLAPNHPNMIDILGWAYLLNGELDKAEGEWSKYPEIENTYQDKTQHLPFRHRLGYVKFRLGKKDQGRNLIAEEATLQLQAISGLTGVGVWPGISKSNNFYDLAAAKSFLGEERKALQYLDSAILHGNDFFWGFQSDPLFEPIRKSVAFQKLIAKPLSHKKFVAKALADALARYQATLSKQIPNPDHL
jgi:TolB-like protein/Tfp pilus assembly protein PilF